MEQSEPRKQTSLKTLRALLSLASRYGLSELSCNGVYIRRGGPEKAEKAQVQVSGNAAAATSEPRDEYLEKLEAEVQAETKRLEAALKDEA